MFKNIRKCLDEFENVSRKLDRCEEITKAEDAIISYFEMHLAEAMLKDGGFGEKVARIILATDYYSNN